MNGMFDVDCPRTPDEDKTKNNNNARRPPPSSSSSTYHHNRAPPIARRSQSSSASTIAQQVASDGSIEVSIAPPNRTSFTPSSSSSARSSRKQFFSPRQSSRSRKGGGDHYRKSSFGGGGNNVGLEPEEYIIGQQQRGGGGGIPPRQPTVASSGGMRHQSIGQQQQQQQIASNSNSHSRVRSHSTEDFGGSNLTNPFDGDTLDGHTDSHHHNNYDNSGGRKNIMSRPNAIDNSKRNTSNNWWREEIIDEGTDKGAAMDQYYYGINPSMKHELYGCPNASSNGSPSAAEVAPTQQYESSCNQQAHSASGGSSIPNHQQQQLSYLPGQTGVGVGVIDDYSFSNVNLSSPGGVYTPHQQQQQQPYQGGSPSASKSLFSSVVQVFSSSNKGSYVPPTNDEQHPWATTERKQKGLVGYLSRLSSTQKMSLGILWMVVVCTVFGVTINQLNKANAANSNGEGGQGGAAQAYGVQLAPPNDFDNIPTFNPTYYEPTPAPSDESTYQPTTPPPSRMPITSSPISGYHSIHGKRHDGTIHPTRIPTTMKPTDAPTSSTPTFTPTDIPSVDIEAVQAAQQVSYCSQPDASPILFYSNHLFNPKNCLWLNNKEGYSDRKDKNCGGRHVVDDFGNVVVYDTTELGENCRQTCRLYNGCDEVLAAAQDQDQDQAAQGDVGGSSVNLSNMGMSVMSGTIPTTSSSTNDNKNVCKDKDGTYKNHLNNEKTCMWLYNDKQGKTDRKDKNCGTDDNPVTDLGKACLHTCYEYDTASKVNIDCIVVDEEVLDVSVDNTIAGQIMRMYSSPSYSFSDRESVP